MRNCHFTYPANTLTVIFNENIGDNFLGYILILLAFSAKQ